MLAGCGYSLCWDCASEDGAVGFTAYVRVNSEGTENLAKAAGECNSDVCFVFGVCIVR